MSVKYYLGTMSSEDRLRMNSRNVGERSPLRCFRCTASAMSACGGC